MTTTFSIEGYVETVRHMLTPVVELELRNIGELHAKALNGDAIDGQPAVLVLQHAYDNRSPEVHNVLYQAQKDGVFSAQDWQELYLPYLRQLERFLDELLDQPNLEPGTVTFPGSCLLPDQLSSSAYYALTELMHDWQITLFFNPEKIRQWQEAGLHNPELYCR